MKNNVALLSLMLTILFSFTVTSVIWAACTVDILPPNPVVDVGGIVQFTAATEGEGCNEPNYT